MPQPSLNSTCQPTATNPRRPSISPAAISDSPRPQDPAFALSELEASRLRTLQERYASIPFPVAIAMVKRASNGPVGAALYQLENALDQLNDLPDFDTLSGSEVRMLDVTLHLISKRIAELQNSLNRVWGSHS